MPVATPGPAPALPRRQLAGSRWLPLPAWWRPAAPPRPPAGWKNAELFGRVLAWIDARQAGEPCPEPALAEVAWDQAHWLHSRTLPGGREVIVEACVATATVILLGVPTGQIVAMADTDISARARAALGLDAYEACLLFGDEVTRWQLHLAALAFLAGWRIDQACLSVPGPRAADVGERRRSGAIPEPADPAPDHIPDDMPAAQPVKAPDRVPAAA